MENQTETPTWGEAPPSPQPSTQPQPQVQTHGAEPAYYRQEPIRRGWLFWALSLVLAALLGAAAGFGASALHPGADGKQGAAGPAGATGAPGQKGDPGEPGLPGSAAQVTDLGVCFSVTYSNGFVQSVGATSPSRHADGTTYCPYGQYVPVQPQPGP
jgi:hypothetical protein